MQLAWIKASTIGYGVCAEANKMRIIISLSIHAPICTRGTAKAKVNDPCHKQIQGIIINNETLLMTVEQSRTA